MENNRGITVEALQNWLAQNKNVVVLDIRPKKQRAESQIPGSIHVDAYEKLNAYDPSVLDEVNIPENVPVVTVCAAGKSSLIAADALRKKGIEAYSLEGGMKAWVIADNTVAVSLERNVNPAI